ncbi:MAG: NHL repeat-containing protein, partial [Phycisphaerae bacterium]
PNFLPAADNLALSNAADVAIAPDGRYYVSDADDNRILSWPSAAAFANGDPADTVIGQPDFVSSAANRGNLLPGPDTFFLPQGLDVDTNGNLWVADAFNNRVLRFDNPSINDTSADLVIGQPDFISNDQNLGQGGTGPDVALPDSLQFPGRVRVRGPDLYVADSGNSRVLHYTNPIANKPFADRVFGQFGNFFKRAKNNDGLGNNGPTASADNLLNPIGIVLDAYANLYVADWANHRVLRFDDPLNTDTTADAVFGQPDLLSNTFDAGGLAAGFQLPIDLQIDSHGNLFVADSMNHRVLAYFDPLFDQITADLVLGQLGSFTADAPNHGLGPNLTDADALQGPTGLAIDPPGNLLVVDTNNNRLLRFDLLLAPAAPPDFDRDGDVDLTDHARLADCLTGPGGPTPPPVCQVPDLDGNSLVDLKDFGLFQRCMSGDGVQADPNCTN